MELTATQCAYAAGLFDGEGSITIEKGQRKDRPNPHHRARVDLAMTHKPTVEWLYQVFGGHFSVRLRGPYVNGGSTKNRPLWRWAVDNASAAEFLRCIRPYLVTKAPQADIALALCERRERGRGKTLTEQELRTRDGMYLEMRALNKRGV